MDQVVRSRWQYRLGRELGVTQVGGLGIARFAATNRIQATMVIETKERAVAADNSFDIVSKVDSQEVENALNMAVKEVRTRFDFKGTDASIKASGDSFEMEANGEERVKAILDVFQTMLVRRKIDLKSLEAGEPRLSGKLWKITASIKQGISTENAKKVSKLIRDEGPKGIRTQIQGEELRVFGKKRDDLQAVQQLVQGCRPRLRGPVRQLSMTRIR